MVRIAVSQIDPRIADSRHNLTVIEHGLDEAVSQGAELTVFPECAVSGYMFDSLASALDASEPIPGPASNALAAMASDRRTYLVAGMLERVGDACYNTAVLAGPAGIEARYRKTHTLCLGVDRFTTPGDLRYGVHALPFGTIGILICYDLRFPEPARILSLEGAQAIVLPTNWPVSSTIQPDVFTRARAAENRVFVVAANRVGEEAGARFLGRSQIVAPDGQILAEAPSDRPALLVEDVDLARADQKHVILSAGEHEMDLYGDRRPDLYERLIERRDLASVP